MTRPSAGARFAVAIAERREDALIYRGFVHLPDADLPLEVEVARPGGACRATVGPPPDDELARAAAALVRSATKTAIAGGGEPPRKIVRWRGRE